MHMKSLVYCLVAISIITACGSQPPTNRLPDGSYALSTRTGISEIDTVLAALELNDTDQLTNVFQWNAVPCANVDGLGGPPACPEGEADGTIVDVFPILGPEGHFLFKSDVTGHPEISASGIFAIYRVSEAVYSDEYFPVGNYAILLKVEEGTPAVILQIRDGKIVRMDYKFDNQAFSETLARDAAEIILGP